MKNSIFILHIAIAVILLTHALPGMFDGGIHSFGQDYLNQIGFAPVGVPLAWAIKLSHVACAILLVANKWVKPAALLTIAILVMGIILVHFKEGWFVVGGGRNGVEYNLLLICVLVAIMFNNKPKTTTIQSQL
ncbi:DoxX family protein [Pedobacter sp. ASV12]|uniref:DoxX family protein n=1 Tax=Pedobacter sp. ASV12 TaxID=2795120 RepID=UPI0018EC5334|nr:DoxX family protein [Pedobacter sp. ASV12]